MEKKIKSLFGLSLAIAFICLGFYILGKVDNSPYPILGKILAYTTIVFFGFWTIIGILGLFGKRFKVLDKIFLKK